MEPCSSSLLRCKWILRLRCKECRRITAYGWVCCCGRILLALVRALENPAGFARLLARYSSIPEALEITSHPNANTLGVKRTLLRLGAKPTLPTTSPHLPRTHSLVHSKYVNASNIPTLPTERSGSLASVENWGPLKVCEPVRALCALTGRVRPLHAAPKWSPVTLTLATPSHIGHSRWVSLSVNEPIRSTETYQLTRE
jgi:hypothetical protein